MEKTKRSSVGDLDGLNDKEKLKMLSIRYQNAEEYIKYLENQKGSEYFSREINKKDVLRYLERKTPKPIKFLLRPFYGIIRKILKV